MPADTVEVVVMLTGLGAVQAGMRQFRAGINGPLEAAPTRIRSFALGLGSTVLAGFSLHRIGAELNQALEDSDQSGIGHLRRGTGPGRLLQEPDHTKELHPAGDHISRTRSSGRFTNVLPRLIQCERLLYLVARKAAMPLQHNRVSLMVNSFQQDAACRMKSKGLQAYKWFWRVAVR